ncbi:hypothetical protein [Chitinophaga nivalis]|uniref:hypothetical protein n=1 Tax=Chitinophaga nivalis TaxID=2991709 RepID=UPI0035314001
MLKSENGYNTAYAAIEIPKRERFEFIEIWYNRQRKHSIPGYLNQGYSKGTRLNTQLKNKTSTPCVEVCKLSVIPMVQNSNLFVSDLRKLAEIT